MTYEHNIMVAKVMQKYSYNTYFVEDFIITEDVLDKLRSFRGFVHTPFWIKLRYRHRIVFDFTTDWQVPDLSNFTPQKSWTIVFDPRKIVYYFQYEDDAILLKMLI